MCKNDSYPVCSVHFSLDNILSDYRSRQTPGTPKHCTHSQRKMMTLAQVNSVLSLFFLASQAMTPTGWDSIPPHNAWAETPEPKTSWESEDESEEPKPKPAPTTKGWTSARTKRKKKRKQAMLTRKINASEADMRTVFFTAAEKQEIQATCASNNVRGLSNGQWRHGDGSIHRTGHTLCYGRCGEWATSLTVREELAGDPDLADWIVEAPDFEHRRGFERDRGDLKLIKPDGTVIWIEVKTITNHGGYNKHDINKAGKLGYVFQRLKWTFRTKKLELTPTFDRSHRDHDRVMNNLLVGVVCTKLKGGGLALTVSKSVFLEPIHTREWVKLRYTSKKDAGLKRATIDPAVV